MRVFVFLVHDIRVRVCRIWCRTPYSRTESSDIVVVTFSYAAKATQIVWGAHWIQPASASTVCGWFRGPIHHSETNTI